MARKKSQGELPPTSPIAFRPCSNGEYCPKPETERERRAERLFLRIVEEKHRRLGMSRRAFSQSASGMAAALLVINQVYGCGSGGSSGQPGGGGSGSGTSPGPGGSGASAGVSGGCDRPDAAGAGGYGVDDGMIDDPMQACEALTGDEFIFDVQVHPANPLTPWTERNLPMDAETFVKTVFVDSDTRVACLTGIPATRDLGASNVEANALLEGLIEQFAGPRLLYHINVDPLLGAAELDYMQMMAETYQVAAWKVYPQVGPWRLDQDEAAGMIEQARALGIKTIAAHRGLGDGDDYMAASSPVDLVLAAQAHPDITFLTYHSGWQRDVAEDHPFDPSDPNPLGVDRLIKALLDSGIGNDGNVYAELGTTWRNLMTAPLDAAHVFGKLLKYLGEDRIVWGTDCVFTGSAQEQIVAFRAFQIPLELQEQHGYPPLSDCAKRKILGLNAAQVYGVDPDATTQAISDDTIAGWKMAYLLDPASIDVPTEKYYGPRTRREFLRFLEWERHLNG
jgi:predicted TIM-barrel fold metal-dependent hydrolase